MPSWSTAVPTASAHDCLEHGRHHQLDGDCLAAIGAWYAEHDPAASWGPDLTVVVETHAYQRAYQQAVQAIAQRLGHCADCALLGAPCARCDPPPELIELLA